MFQRNEVIPEDGGDNNPKTVVATYMTTWHHNPEDNSQQSIGQVQSLLGCTAM
jgi:hypothetical protein